MLLENGVYQAVVKDISVHLRTSKDKKEREVERLTGSFRLECEGKELVHKEWLELNDGSISDKIINRLRECFPKWDGSIEALEQGFCVQGAEVKVTLENEQDREDPDKWWTRVKFMDPQGGTRCRSAALPVNLSRTTLVGNYGSRFRALAGGTQVGGGTSPSKGGSASGGKPETEKAGPAIAPQSGPPPAPPRPPVAPATKATAISTLEECWDALCKKHPGEFREQVSERWFKLLEQAGEGKDQADFGPEDWGRVMGVIALPF